MTVVGVATMGGTNSTDISVGPDGLRRQHRDFVSPGSLTVLNGSTMQAVTTVANVGVGPGAVFVDPSGLAYISGFLFGTAVWNTTTRQFVRPPDNAICAKLSNGSCRGAFAATTDKAGNVYQAFFGTQPSRTPVYKAGTFATDSIAVGSGPSALTVRVLALVVCALHWARDRASTRVLASDRAVSRGALRRPPPGVPRCEFESALSPVRFSRSRSPRLRR
jgi:hypothetical protein